VTVNGEDRDVFKDPVEGHDKASKRGRLRCTLKMASGAQCGCGGE